MNLKNLSVLKEKLLAAQDFDDPWNYFFEEFGMNPAFMRVGTQTKNAVLSKIVETVGREISYGKGKISNLLLVEIKEHQFIHGAGFFQGKMATVIYFSDIDMGLFAVMSDGPGHNIFLARFSSVKMESDKTVFFQPGNNTVN
ncbi:MAG: hypothetical protein GY862_37065 [Gammaproteobacteria bacterium]|nr:hypothetical protein [Gammaproteobacteria bacterium]